jgi:hypothetical protein
LKNIERDCRRALAAAAWPTILPCPPTGGHTDSNPITLSLWRRGRAMPKLIDTINLQNFENDQVISLS